MKQAILIVMALALGLALGCASSKVSEGDDDAGADSGEPRMRTPTPEAPVYTQHETADDASETALVSPEETAGSPAEGPAYRFKAGDGVVINITGISMPQAIEDVVDERGYISLPFIGSVTAGGKTSSELEADVHAAYVPDYYKYATISVFVPARGYFIRGEVRSPGRFPLIHGMTILQAVATAGGYTEYAAPRRVRILRHGETIKINLLDLDKHPEKDIELKARDVIIVPRGWI